MSGYFVSLLPFGFHLWRITLGERRICQPKHPWRDRAEAVCCRINRKWGGKFVVEGISGALISFFCLSGFVQGVTPPKFCKVFHWEKLRKGRVEGWTTGPSSTSDPRDYSLYFTSFLYYPFWITLTSADTESSSRCPSSSSVCLTVVSLKHLLLQWGKGVSEESLCVSITPATVPLFMSPGRDIKHL